MKRLAIMTALALVTAFHLVNVKAATAVPIDDPNTVPWSSIRGYSSQQFGTYFSKKKAQGYRVIDIEVDTIQGKPKYSAVWQYNSDKRGWASWRNLTHQQFSEKWKSYRSQGYRLIDQESYVISGKRRYAGVWVENKEKLSWVSYRNVKTDAFASKFITYKQQGYRMVDIEAYPSGNTTLYAAIWLKEPGGPAWAEYRDMSKDAYAKRFKDFAKKGYRVMDLESYRQKGRQKYAAIWVKNTNGRGWVARRNMTATWYANYWKTYQDEGYRLIDFEAYPTSQGTRYAGVWRQNGSRLNWPHKRQVDKAIKAYRDQNDVPGISVAIAENGKIVYSRGFGYADVGKKKVAHAKTIYRAASVSKAITAVMAMRLQDKNQLDLDRASRSYVTSLPSHHTHNVRQLIRHRSGIRHYKGSKRKNCEIPNNASWKDSSNTQYATATAALQVFQNDPLMFSPGAKSCYTTHGYTMLGAVLEKAGKRSYAALLQQELSQRLNLPTLRPEYRHQFVAERATIYNGKTTPTSRDNLSWKYTGGGLEASVNDLTRLGIKVINGSAVSTKARKGFWSGSSFSHSGAQRGARSYWRMYFNSNKVISILSNRRSGDPGKLANTIGNGREY